jgi:hypothetical protein
MVFIPIVPATHFREASFGTIWGDIAAGADFNDTIDPDYLDNGAGLQWNACLTPGEATTLADQWSFGVSESEAISTISGGFRAPGPLASELTTYIPTPLDVTVDPGVIGTNLLFAALAMIAFTSASGLLTRLLGENQGEVVRRLRVVRWVSAAQQPRSALGPASPSVAGRPHRLSAHPVLRLVFSLLDRSDSLAWPALIFGSMTTLWPGRDAADIVSGLQRCWGLPPSSPRPTGVLLAVLSTAASPSWARSGPMFGTLDAFDIDPKAGSQTRRWLLSRRRHAPRDRGRRLS